MIIRKTQQPSDYPSNSISNVKTTGTTNTYSCDYINGIIESGSNENGNWIKYIDGTMVCSSEISREVNFVQSGNSYTGETTNTIAFPQDFIGKPLVAINTQHVEEYYYCAVYGVIINKTSITKIIFLRTSSPGSAVEIPFSYIAIGKWK